MNLIDLLGTKQWALKKNQKKRYDDPNNLPKIEHIIERVGSE
jgi:hypothetical protein